MIFSRHRLYHVIVCRWAFEFNNQTKNNSAAPVVIVSLFTQDGIASLETKQAFVGVWNLALVGLGRQTCLRSKHGHRWEDTNLATAPELLCAFVRIAGACDRACAFRIHARTWCCMMLSPLIQNVAPLSIPARFVRDAPFCA